jgi:hypothetical protein
LDEGKSRRDEEEEKRKVHGVVPPMTFLQQHTQPTTSTSWSKQNKINWNIKWS